MKTYMKILISAACIAAALVAFEMGLDFAAIALFLAPYILIPAMPRKSLKTEKTTK